MQTHPSIHSTAHPPTANPLHIHCTSIHCTYTHCYHISFPHEHASYSKQLPPCAPAAGGRLVALRASACSFTAASGASFSMQCEAISSLLPSARNSRCAACAENDQHQEYQLNHTRMAKANAKPSSPLPYLATTCTPTCTSATEYFSSASSKPRVSAAIVPSSNTQKAIGAWTMRRKRGG